MQRIRWKKQRRRGMRQFAGGVFIIHCQWNEYSRYEFNIFFVRGINFIMLQTIDPCMGQD